MQKMNLENAQVSQNHFKKLYNTHSDTKYGALILNEVDEQPWEEKKNYNKSYRNPKSTRNNGI